MICKVRLTMTLFAMLLPAASARADGDPASDVLAEQSLFLPQDAGLTASQQTVDAGSLQYAKWCMVCHGFGASSGGSMPDLRYSAPAVLSSYPQIVLNGASVSRGMPSFKEWLSTDDVEAIRAFVISQRNRIGKN